MDELLKSSMGHGRIAMRRLVVPLAAREAADPSRFGPKAANLAALGHAGLPTPGGFCVDAAAYRKQVRSLDLEEEARGVFSAGDRPQARRYALQMKLGLMDREIDEGVLEPLLAAWRELTEGTRAPGVVRSSALVEDRHGSSFAGQFESYLGLGDEAEFLTAVRACWAALWSTRALRYMATHGLDPADTAMALLLQPLVPARAAGGGLSRTAEGHRHAGRDRRGARRLGNQAAAGAAAAHAARRRSRRDLAAPPAAQRSPRGNRLGHGTCVRDQLRMRARARRARRRARHHRRRPGARRD